MPKLKHTEIFRTQGQPTVTYVKRESGKFEKQLSDALDSGGMICLLTGPSKTGKTTLYTEVAKGKKMEPLVVRCHRELRAKDIWKIALEEVNFERIRESSISKEKTKLLEGKIGGKISWSWLAGLIGEVKTGISSKDSDSTVREKILGDPQPSHLLPILQNLPYLFILEDFHYLSSDVKKTVFQQWKSFVDNEVSVIVVGTTHHASDLAYANRDLIGRYSQIDVSNWSADDLCSIPKQGFGYLKIEIQENLLKLIAKESVGLPIISQAVSLQLILDKKTLEFDNKDGNIFSRQNIFDALNGVAVNRFGTFSSIHDRLIRGPRSKRKYNTYELVLSTFAQDPLAFTLTREEINSRIQKLSEMGVNQESIPPTGSITSMCNALESFQRKLQIELLEWSDNDQRLYIIEPTFLFYLRWKEKRKTLPTINVMIAEMIAEITNRLTKMKMRKKTMR